ncbi:oligosaccharide flippase family protein [Cognatitamlana onchidii]|uniref:oligosaccharide flippase family protein n=1 Tax=Cognatitamlana onchidii TaxID=2562860 RepID=UPI0010A62074|nr:oligosaccharide flippase family protein [Algibacter onchidii]
MNNYFKKFKNIVDNNLLKIGVFNSFSLFIKFIAGLISSKALAYFIGPAGLAVCGVFREFFFMTVNVSSLGLQKGIINYSAKFKNEKKNRQALVDTLIIIGTVISLVMAIILFSFSKAINGALFPNYDFVFVIKILALGIPLSVFTGFYISFINGLGYTSSIVKINASVSIFNAICIIIFTYYFGVAGALLGIVFFFITQSIAILVFKPRATLFQLLRIPKFSIEVFKKLSGYALMTIISLCLFPFISILIRTEIIDYLGEDAAGYWEAMKRISDNYLFFASSLVVLSVLPELSSGKKSLKSAVLSFYGSIIPVFILGLFILFFLRKYIVLAFYSEEFMTTTILFKWHEIGDLFRVLGLVIAANFFATRDIKGYIITDMFLAAVLYVSSMFFIERIGLEGGAFAYFLTYFLYFLLLLGYFRKKLFTKRVTTFLKI